MENVLARTPYPTALARTCFVDCNQSAALAVPTTQADTLEAKGRRRCQGLERP